MSQRAPASDMPLHCNICPKKPNFSDVSHLLTHISSKGHLSNYFKTQVKATQDVAAHQDLLNYDTWYNLWNVQALMRERMEQKEKKKGSTGQSTPRGGSFQATPASTARSTPSFTGVNNANNNRRPIGLRENVLDPQLDRRVKEEPMSRSVTPGSGYEIPMYHRVYNPMMIGPSQWAGTPSYSSAYAPTEESTKQDDLDSSNGSNAEDSDYEAETSTRSRRKRRRRNESASTVSLQLPYDEDWEMADTIVDGSKMKGVYWDGMAMFDSATPEMKRKRNQKKSFSVVEQLRTTSGIIQPAEMVYDAGWNHRKTRTITGDPEDSDDDGSRLSGETTPEPTEPPPKKKQTRRPRQPLQEKSTNSGRPNRRRKAASGLVKSRLDGQDDDDDLMYSTAKARKRLSIHRDDSGPDITFNEPSTFGLLTSAFNTTYRNAYQSAQIQPHVFQHNQQVYHQHSMHHASQHSGPFNSFRQTAAGHPTPNLGSFGSLNSNQMFQANGLMPMMGNQPVMSAFQQQLAPQYVPGHAAFPNELVGRFPSNHDLNNYDIHDQEAADVAENTDTAVKHMNENSAVNPLFLSSQNSTDPEEEDDDATVSGPPSEN